MSWIISHTLATAAHGNLPCSQVSAGQSLPGTDLGGAASAPSSQTPTPSLYCAPGKMMEACRRFRSGMTAAPLTADLGVAVWKWSLPDGPVRTCPSLEKAQDLPDHEADCGQKWHALSMKYDPAKWCWKTVHNLFEMDCPSFSLTSVPWGMMRAGELFRRVTQVPRIDGTGSFAWPTPVSSDCGRTVPYKQGGTPLSAAVRIWATPAARDWKDTPGMARDAVNPDGSARSRTDQLARQVYADGGQGLLHPDWTEWLMQWPVGWTSLTPLPQAELDHWQSATPDQWWQHEHAAGGRVLPRTGHKIPARTNRLRCIGNGIVPAALVLAYHQLKGKS